MISKFSKIVKNLSSKSEAKRLDGMKELEAVDMEEMTADLLEHLIYASAAVHKDNKAEEKDCSKALLKFAARYDMTDMIHCLNEAFEGMSVWAQALALTLCTRTNTEESLETFLSLLETYVKNEKVVSFPIELSGEEQHAASLLFPSLFDYLNYPTISYGIKYYLWNCLNLETIPTSVAELADRPLLDEYYGLKEELFARQGELASVKWTNKYQSIRDDVGLLLDLFGYMDSDMSVTELRDALKLSDLKLRFFAVVSLLRRGEEVPEKHFEQIAADAEMRNYFYDALSSLGLSDRFPREYFTQQAFAESDMVNWLIYPTEMGHEPSEIECAEVITRYDHEAGEVAYYVFRFRSDDEDWIEEEWMAGVAGYYKVNDGPTTKSGGSTFSMFESWEGKTPAEHYAGIISLLSSF